jgi:hypothetical protein
VRYPLAGFLEPLLFARHRQNLLLALEPFRMKLLKMPVSSEPIFGDASQVVKRSLVF